MVGIDDQARALELVRHVREHHPGLRVLARAFDRGHGYELRHAGADVIVSETYHSALEAGGEARLCVSCGFSDDRPEDGPSSNELQTRVTRPSARRVETEAQVVRLVDPGDGQDEADRDRDGDA